MQIWTIQKGFEPLEWDSNYSNANSRQWNVMHLNSYSKHSNGILTIQMQIRCIRKGFESFEWKFKPFQRNSNCSKPKLNHSNEIRSIRMQISNIRKAFECKFEPLERDSKHSKAYFKFSKRMLTIWNQIRTHSNEIRSIWMEIWTIQKGL